MEATFFKLFLVTFVAVVGAIHEVPESSDAENKENLSNFPTIPSFNAERDMVFYLFGEDNSEEVIQLDNLTSLQESSFRADRPSRFYIGGFLSTKSEAERLRGAYLKKGGLNYFYVDWAKGSETIFYHLAASVHVPRAGRALARFIDFLVKGGASYDTTYLIGHSLGAHIVGIAGKNTARKVNTITGLDPANPSFYLFRPQDRIARGDAKYVEIIHTENLMGFFAVLGDADFFVNGGKAQPGCFLDLSCSHARSVFIFRESVNNNEFWAAPCSFKDISNDKCNSKSYTVRMGGEPSNGAETSPPSGTFYLRTHSKSPYALGKQGN